MVRCADPGRRRPRLKRQAAGLPGTVLLLLAELPQGEKEVRHVWHDFPILGARRLDLDLATKYRANGKPRPQRKSLLFRGPHLSGGAGQANRSPDLEKAFLTEGKENKERLYCRDKVHLGAPGHDLVYSLSENVKKPFC